MANKKICLKANLVSLTTEKIVSFNDTNILLKHNT